MKKQILISTLLLTALVFSNCNKAIEEPEQKADGSNVVYIKVDDKESYLLDARNKRLHRKTAGKFDDYDNDIVRFSEFTINNRTILNYSIYLKPFNYKKAELQIASLILRFDKQTLELDTAFMRANLENSVGSIIRFAIDSDDEYKNYFIDSILDYKVIKADTENKILTFSATCTYGRSPFVTPTNPKLYFYLDLKYSL